MKFFHVPPMFNMPKPNQYILKTDVLTCYDFTLFNMKKIIFSYILNNVGYINLQIYQLTYDYPDKKIPL